VDLDNDVNGVVPLVAVTAKTIKRPTCSVVGVNDVETWPEITAHPAGSSVTASGTSDVHEYQAFTY
jgi:hypothetical protein